MRTFLIGVAAALVPILSLSVNAQSRIRVLDLDSIPVPYAIVRVGDAEARATDSSGSLRLTAKLGDVAALGVQRIGYRPFKANVNRSVTGEYVVVMQAIPRGLDSVRTIAKRSTPLSRTGFYDRMHRVQNGALVGEFITPEELELRNVDQISHILRGRKTVSVGAYSGNGARSRAVLYGRGGGCPMTVLLNGERVNGMLHVEGSGATTSLNSRGGFDSRFSSRSPDDLSDKTSIDELTAARQVMAIEIYSSTSNAPAELIPLTGGGSCGIVAIWTGRRQ